MLNKEKEMKIYNLPVKIKSEMEGIETDEKPY